MARRQSSRMASSSSTTESGGRPPLLSPRLIEPAGDVEAQAHLVGRGHLVAHLGAVGPQVLVVEDGGAPAVGQFQQAHPGGQADVLGGHAGPDGVEALQPGEQAHVLGAGHGPGEGLVEVVVGVDQAGEEEHPGGVHHLVGLGGQVGGGPDLLDEAVAGEQAPAGDLPPGRVHGDQGVGVADEQGGHGGRVGRERRAVPTVASHPGDSLPMAMGEVREGEGTLAQSRRRLPLGLRPLPRPTGERRR